MTKIFLRPSLLLLALLFVETIAAQSAGGSYFSPAIILIAVLAVLVLLAVLYVGESLLGDSNAEVSNAKGGTSATSGGSTVKLKKGYNINLEGEAVERLDAVPVTRYAVKPTDFQGISPIPKVVPIVGDEVMAGDVLFFDKKRPEVKYVAPVSGEVVAINRGAKRSIAEVVILADKEQKNKTFEAFNWQTSSREDLVNYMLESGVWALLRQRPFELIPEPNEIPRDIFISTFSTAPLAPKTSMILNGKEMQFQKGLDVLNRLTSGSVFLGMNGDGYVPPAVSGATGVVKNYFSGPHPAGNVGVQIHHTEPINKGDMVWVLGVQEVITIGTLFLDRVYDASRVVAVTGQSVSNPRYFRVKQGASLDALLKDNLKEDNVRVISGDVLTGKQVAQDGFLGFYDDQITVIPEGNEYEMFGWLLPLKSRPSISKTFPNIFSDQKFEVSTNTHGEKRAFVVTGQYESVLPMDIYPQLLCKSIMAGDFERMEGLGIYELAPEDIAICEFVCTSKQPLQEILADGLEMIREQG